MQKKSTTPQKRGKGQRLTVEERLKLQELKKEGVDPKKAARRLKIPYRTAKRWQGRDYPEAKSRKDNGKDRALFRGMAERALVELARLLNCSTSAFSAYVHTYMPVITPDTSQPEGKFMQNRTTIWRLTRECLTKPPRQKKCPKGALGVHAVVVEWKKRIDVPGEKRDRGRPKTDPVPQKTLILAVADRSKMKFVWDVTNFPSTSATVMAKLKDLVGKYSEANDKHLTIHLVAEKVGSDVKPTLGLPVEVVREGLGGHVSVLVEKPSKGKGQIRMKWTYSSTDELREKLVSIEDRTVYRKGADRRPVYNRLPAVE